MVAPGADRPAMTLSPFGSTRTMSKLGAIASGDGAGVAAARAGWGTTEAAGGGWFWTEVAGAAPLGAGAVPPGGADAGCDIVAGALSGVCRPSKVSQLRTPSNT